MKISFGWASSYASRKFGVELDDSDIVRLVRETGLEPDTVIPALTETQLFSWLSLEAEYRTLQSYMKYLDELANGGQQLPADADSTRTRFGQLAENRKGMLLAVRGFFTGEDTKTAEAAIAAAVPQPLLAPAGASA
jgi:hypothetical protein